MLCCFFEGLGKGWCEWAFSWLEFFYFYGEYIFVVGDLGEREIVFFFILDFVLENCFLKEINIEFWRINSFLYKVISDKCKFFGLEGGKLVLYFWFVFFSFVYVVRV